MSGSAIKNVTRNRNMHGNQRGSDITSKNNTMLMKERYEGKRRVHYVGFAKTGSSFERSLSVPETVDEHDKPQSSTGPQRVAGGSFHLSTRDLMLTNSHVIKHAKELEETKTNVVSITTSTTASSTNVSISGSSTADTDLHDSRRSLREIYSIGARAFEESLLKNRDSTIPVKEAVIRNARCALAYIDTGDLGLDDDESIVSLDSF